MSNARKIMAIARQLAGVKRYSRDFSFHQESVLEHTGFVAMYALMVARESSLPIDYFLLMAKAVMHDAEEGSMGDIPRTTKYMSPEITKALKAAEHKVAELVLKPINMFEFWQAAKDQSIEGQIVALADMAATVYQTVNELNTLGNGSYQKVKEEVSGFIAERRIEVENTKLDAYYKELEDILREGKL